MVRDIIKKTRLYTKALCPIELGFAALVIVPAETPHGHHRLAHTAPVIKYNALTGDFETENMLYVHWPET